MIELVRVELVFCLRGGFSHLGTAFDIRQGVIARKLRNDGIFNHRLFADVIAGAWKNDAPTVPKVTKDTGSLSLYSGNGFGFIDILYGDIAKDYFGAAVSAGDINSDGKADLIIGIPGFDAPGTKPVKDAGAVRVLSGAGF